MALLRVIAARNGILTVLFIHLFFKDSTYLTEGESTSGVNGRRREGEERALR